MNPYSSAIPAGYLHQLIKSKNWLKPIKYLILLNNFPNLSKIFCQEICGELHLYTTQYIWQAEMAIWNLDHIGNLIVSRTEPQWQQNWIVCVNFMLAKLWVLKAGLSKRFVEELWIRLEILLCLIWAKISHCYRIAETLRILSKNWR